MSDEEPTGNKRHSPGRREYDEANEKLDKHIEENNERLHRIYKRGLIALAVIGFFTAASLVGFGIVLHEQQNTQDQLKALVVQNKATANAIQQQRIDFTRTTCRETNRRHDKTTKSFKTAADLDVKNARKLGLNPGEIRRREAVTQAIIDLLQPKQNCEELVRQVTKPTKKG